MRLFVFSLLGVIALFESALAYVDASARTTVGVYANVWDERDSGSGGCSPDGCTPDLTRDNDFDEESRWSCAKELEDETCEICYTFAEPQDIINVGIAFHKGDERPRKFKLTARDDDGSKSTYVFTSSGDTTYYEYFYLDTDETELLCMKPVGLDDDEWLSVLEVGIYVK